jgi:hypothetical protein
MVDLAVGVPSNYDGLLTASMYLGDFAYPFKYFFKKTVRLQRLESTQVDFE